MSPDIWVILSPLLSAAAAYGGVAWRLGGMAADIRSLREEVSWLRARVA